MKRLMLVLLLAVPALPSCTTMHDAAVSTFRVVDAPHQFVRRKLGMDEEPPNGTTTTTTTETTYSDTGAPYPPPQQPYSASPQPYQAYPPPPVQTERRITTNERQSQPPPAETRPTATPRVVTSERTTSGSHAPEPKPTATPHTTSTQPTTDLPYAKPVPGKPGYVFSPYDPNGGYVDVKGYSPGQKVKDPYSGKIFLVP